MKLLSRKIAQFFLLVSICLLLFFGKVLADDTPTPTPTPGADSQQVQDLQNQIQQLEDKISSLQGQEKTLSSQITVMDSQIQLTQLRINATKKQILDLILDIDTASKKISSLESSVSTLTNVLLNRIVATYEVASTQPLQILLTSSTISDFVQRANYLRIAQAHDKRLIYDTVQAKNDYQNQKNILEDQKKQVELLNEQLQAYTAELDQEKTDKQQLLSQTQGDEANYQRLLAAARAQLAGFSSFAQSQGGASLLSGQTECDSWGCYYNQRDSQWGGLALNHTQYTIASDGCLLTSVAMVITHYGHRVTPIDVNSNPSNFASYYPAYLLYTVNVAGVTATRVSSVIDGTLSSGNPVIVGIRYSSGDTHFVVLKSGSNGDYMMNDPFTPNGHDISFTSHYSLGSIFEVDKVIVQ
ncbi:MAG: hypothetical protein ACREGI_05175 [Candidatus Levyibacteriota bacterium]